MNQGRFRLVFSGLHGMMMEVAEFVSAQGKAEAAVDRSAPASAHESSDTPWFATRKSTFAALCLFGLQPLLIDEAHAQATLPVTPDRNASGAHPVVSVAGNGVPVVNIVAPNAAGTSHNKYTDYNVGQKGLVLNNSGQNSQTQTAGWVQGNPFMGNQSARTILNEVTSGNRSQLLGMTEVAGRAANVVIANPAGIYCNGCGFIAAPRVTLTTGVPVLDANGALSRLNVMQGGITIDGQGLDTRGASQTDLIARAMEINGQIWAQQLNATAGAIQVNYTDGGATPIPGTGARPVVAIDVSALGSMYGNNAVRLVGTELGVGVNLGGMLNSLTGDIQVASNGDVTITPKGALLAANNAQVSATSITNAGTVASDGNVALIATQALTNVGTVTARTNLGGTGQSVANSGTLAGGIATDGTVNAAGSVSVIASGVLQNSGTIQGGQNALVQAANGDLSNGSIHAGKVATLAVAGDVLHTNATLDAPSLDVRVGGTLTNQHGSIASQAPLNLTVGALDNRSGVVSSQGSLDIDTANVQNAGGQLVAQQDIAVHASNIGNQGGTIGSVTGAAAVSATVLDNSSGTISAAQASSVTASNLTNAQGQISGDWVNVAADSLDTQGGKIVAVHDARVSATGNLDNSAGTIGSQQSNASITAGGVLANVGGTIASAGNITTQAQSLDNSSGIISAGQTLNVTASNLTNASGQMSGDQVNVAARTLDTHAGQIIAIHDVTISASGELNNAAGTIGSQQGETSVAAGGALSNASGTITSRGGTNVSANALDNSNGIVNAARQTAIRAVNVTNANGQIGGDTVSVAASSVDTRGGKIIAVHDVTVTASGDLNNAAGTIGSQQGNATVSAGGALSNTNGGLITSADNTTLAARSIDNTAGAISAAHALTLDGPLTSNAGGELSGDTVDLHVDGILNNRAGRIVGTRVSDIDGAISVDNTNGTLGTALGDFSLTVNGAIANTGGTIASGGNSTVSAQSFDNTDGRFAAANRATLSANSATNTRGQISGNAVQVDVADALNNASGQIASASTVRLKAANIDNTSGQVSAQDVRVKTGRLTNDQGAIIAGNTLALDTAWISNRAGTVTSAGTAKISSSNDIDNTNGTLAANDTATITASSLENAGGVLGSVNGALTVNTTGALNNDTGTLASAVDTTLNAHALTNHGGTISGRSVAVTTQTADNSNGAIVGTAGNVSIDAAQGLTNTQGLVQAAVALNVDTHGAALDNRSGLITGATQVNVNAGQLDNRDHGAISSADTLAVHAANLVNDTGSITAQNALNVSADGTLSNRGGTLGSNGVATLSADSVDNDAGLIHAGGALTINARAISNTNTNAASRGIEGATVTLATVVLDNTQGAIRSDQSTAIGTGTLNNSQGEIASGGALDLVASGDVTNTQGDLNGGTHTNVTAHGLTGDGTIQSQGDVNLSLQSDFNNTGSVQADHDVNVNTSGDIANSGSITAGNALTVAGQNVTNTAAGVIAGQASTHVIAAHSVNNDGLINGGDTRIDAQAVTNTGRIYGDSIAVSAGTLDNDINGEGTAGVLASRGDIDLGVGTLTNREGAYILANNDLRIAGALDASGHANRDTTGNARQVTNDSATIEAGGNLTIDAARVDNLNSHFATATTTTTSTAPQFYYMQPGSDVLLGAADTWFYLNESNHLHALMPGTINPKDAWHSQTEYWTMLLPSTQYPQARYGPPFNYDGDTTPNRNGEDVQLGKGLHSIPYAISAGGKFWTTAYPVGLAYSPETTYQTGAGENVQTFTAPEAFAYTPDNPIWAVFGVSPPAALVPEPANACAPGDRTCNASFTAQHDAWQSAHAAAVVQYQALNDAIAAFDTDFSSRLVSNFDMVTVNSQTTTEDSVTYSAPGQILAGGNLSINGSLNNDKSQIAAGGDFNGTGAQTINADALGVKQTIAQGTMTASIAQGGGRQWTSDQPFSKTLDDQVIHLSIAPTTASVTPGAMRSVFVTSATAQGAGGAVDIASGTAQGAALNGVNGAASIDGVNVAAGTAGAVAAPGAIALDPSGASATAATPVSTGPTAPLGGEVIRTMTPPLRLPNNALYRTQSDPGSHYLIETDPAYANFKTWISSDTMIRALNQSPDNVIKRIGDGFYEQQLVAQQVLTLTGQRFVGDYTSNEAEYKALLNGGVQAGQAFGLTIGTALTDAQMAALTSDIVWLVKQTVTLADGSTQEVLTPQVYTQAQVEDQMRIMGATVNGTVESGAPDTLIGQKPTDAGAGWLSAGLTADGKPILTQTNAAVDPQLQAYIVNNYASAAPGAVPSIVSGYTASPTQPQIGPQYGSTGSAGTICPSGNCGAVNTTVTPMTRDQLADSAASVSTAAGRFGAVTGAAAEIPTPYSPAFATAAFAATVAGWIAGGVEQAARPNPRPYISGGLVDIGNYLVSDRFPMAGPAINEVGEAIKGSSWMDQFNKGTKK